MPTMNPTKTPCQPTSRKWNIVLCVRDLLFLFGVIALTYVGYTLVQARQTLAVADQVIATAGEAADRSHGPQPLVPLHRGDVMGRLDIPRLGLSVPVLQGTSPRILRLGAGHIEGTPLPGENGNSAFAGHRDTFFRGLKDIHSSDEIVLQTPKRVLRYAVDWVKVVDPADVSVLETTGDTSTLTLVTCYPFYLVGPAPRRYVVHAHIRQ